jgi:hypothetical protein
MSAKRRQEAIARFVIPVENSVQSSTIPAPTKRNVRPTRQPVTKHQRVLNDEDSVTESDSDFSIANLGEQTEDEDNVSNRKGKGKAKDESTYADDMFCSGDNPRVMLISLKAVTKTSRSLRVASSHMFPA